MALRSFYVAVFIIFGINNQLYASHDWYGKVFVDYLSSLKRSRIKRKLVNNKVA